MRNCLDAEFLDQLREPHVRQDVPAHAREDQSAPVLVRSRLGEDFQRSCRERNAMRPSCLHAFGGHSPDVAVDFIPPCAPDFTGAARRQPQKLECGFCRPPLRAYYRERRLPHLAATHDDAPWERYYAEALARLRHQPRRDALPRLPTSLPCQCAGVPSGRFPASRSRSA